MAESPDYKELLQILNEFEFEYLIVGGFVALYCVEGEGAVTWELNGHTQAGGISVSEGTKKSTTSPSNA